MFVTLTEELRPKTPGQGKPFRGTLTDWSLRGEEGDRYIYAGGYVGSDIYWSWITTSRVENLIEIDTNTWLVETRNSVYLLQNRAA